MVLSTILLFIATEFFLALYPGPAVLLVISQGVKYGGKSSLLGTTGIITGNAIYFSASAIGLGGILIASEELFLVIKYIGAIYLLYLGIKMIYKSLIRNKSNQEERILTSKQKLYREGLLTQLANPKAILFFAALLPQFIDTHKGMAYQFVILGIISVMIEYPILATYGWLAGKGADWIKESQYAKWIDRVAGSLLIGAGIKLVVMKKT